MLTYPAITVLPGGNTAGANAAISSGTFVLAGGNNITLSQNGNTVSVVGGAGGAGDGLNRISAGTQIADTLATVSFANANGVSFGLSNSSVMTASHNGLTTARASNDAVGLNTAQSNVTWTVNSGGVSLDGRGYAGTNTGATNASVTVNSGGVSFAVGNYITTARASNDAIGLATAQSNITWTVNSAGISLDGRGYAGTVSGGTNATLTVNSNGVSVSVAAQSAQPVAASAGNGSVAFSTLSFSNANGISFSTAAGPAIVASHNGLTTARASNDGIGLATAQSNVTWTANSAGLSLDARNYAGVGTSATNASVTLNSNGLAISVAAPGGGGGGAAVTVSDSAGSGTIGQLAFTNLNGITLSLSTGAAGSHTIVGSHNAITTGRASTDALGLNTAQSNVTWTANSAGVSLDARGYAGTGTTFNGANLSGSMTVNSNGVNLSVSAGAPTAASVSRWYPGNIVDYPSTAQANSNVTVVPFILPVAVVFSQVRAIGSFSVSTATNNSSAYVDVSASAVFYSRNGSTLSSIFSGNGTLTATFSSNATGSITGPQFIPATFAQTTLPAGEYYMAFHVSTNNTATGGANTTALGNTMTMGLNNRSSSGAAMARGFGVGTGATGGNPLGLGVISTGATLASIPFSSITGSGTRNVLANLWFELANATVF
jgi:hypothetical protein